MISSGGCPTIMTRNFEHSSIRPKSLAASSIRSITATLFNGKQLEIQYTFDPSRSKEDRVLIARHCLLPVIGGSLEKFEKPQVDECEYEHFHHYCSVHVASWFENYLLLLILFKESRQLFDHEIANIFLLDKESRLYFNRGERPISEFLLKYAMEINIVADDGRRTWSAPARR